MNACAAKHESWLGAFSNVAELHDALLKENTGGFVSKYILEPIPFIFANDISAWVEWKHTLASALDVDPRDIVLTGSAAVGWSLNPNKAFSQFHIGSDIDCAIISNYHFDVAWRYLRQQRVSWLTLSPADREAIRIHQKNFVFSGTIAANWILALLPFAQKWQAGLDYMSTIAPTLNRDVKLRIYKDFDALRYYQISNIERIRLEIVSASSNDEVAIDQTVDKED